MNIQVIIDKIIKKEFLEDFDLRNNLLTYNKEMPEQKETYSGIDESYVNQYERLRNIGAYSSAVVRHILFHYPIISNFIGKNKLFNNHEIILDLGCGVADLRNYLYRNAFDCFYIGLEARQKILQESSKLSFNQDSLLINYDLTLPNIFNKNSIDIIVNIGVIEHLFFDQQKIAIQNMSESLKEDGIIYITPSHKWNKNINQHAYEPTIEEFESIIPKDLIIYEKFISECSSDFINFLSNEKRQFYEKLKNLGIDYQYLRNIFIPFAEGNFVINETSYILMKKTFLEPKIVSENKIIQLFRERQISNILFISEFIKKIEKYRLYFEVNKGFISFRTNILSIPDFYIFFKKELSIHWIKDNYYPYEGKQKNNSIYQDAIIDKIEDIEFIVDYMKNRFLFKTRKNIELEIKRF